MKNSILSSIISAIVFATIAITPAHATVNVVASTPELAAIAKEVGGNRVSVISLAKPGQNYHQVEAKPTDVVKVSRADVFVRVGMDLDMWADAVLNSARNGKVQPGGAGYVDAGRLIKKKEVPTGQINGASGDIHVMGNPHYWLDPANGKVIAYEILIGLRNVDPNGGTYYNSEYTRFTKEIDSNMARWKSELAPYKGHGVVSYHDEWIYFYDRFGLKPFGYLEPKPGIPPSASHVNNLIGRMKQAGIKSVIVPNIYPMRFGNLVARETGGSVVAVPYSVGTLGTSNYIDYINAIVAGFQKALQ